MTLILPKPPRRRRWVWPLATLALAPASFGLGFWWGVGLGGQAGWRMGLHTAACVLEHASDAWDLRERGEITSAEAKGMVEAAAETCAEHEGASRR